MSTILVVEDDASATISLSAVLSEAGFCVHCEREIERAVAAALSFDFDAAVVVGGSTELSGSGVAGELRTHDPDLPIFVCTDLSEESVPNWAVQERMLILENPVDDGQLVWLLQAHVGGRS
jgi:DNA-binding response OmpR family regulator